MLSMQIIFLYSPYCSPTGERYDRPSILHLVSSSGVIQGQIDDVPAKKPAEMYPDEGPPPRTFMMNVTIQPPIVTCM